LTLAPFRGTTDTATSYYRTHQVRSNSSCSRYGPTARSASWSPPVLVSARKVSGFSSIEYPTFDANAHDAPIVIQTCTCTCVAPYGPTARARVPFIAANYHRICRVFFYTSILFDMPVMCVPDHHAVVFIFDLSHQWARPRVRNQAACCAVLSSNLLYRIIHASPCGPARQTPRSSANRWLPRRNHKLGDDPVITYQAGRHTVLSRILNTDYGYKVS
jgi:hypothetical protein